MSTIDNLCKYYGYVDYDRKSGASTVPLLLLFFKCPQSSSSWHRCATGKEKQQFIGVSAWGHKKGVGLGGGSLAKLEASA